MKLRRFNKFVSCMVLVLTLFISFSPQSHAQAAIPVHDQDEWLETFAQYIRQGFQWLLQKEQFILQNRNTLALAAEIWTLANSIVNQVRNLDNVHSLYALFYGGTEDFMNDFQGLYEYAADPCSRFYPSLDGGVKSCPIKTFKNQERANAMALAVDKGDINVNLQQQQEIPSQVAAYEAVKSQPVLGRMQALQKQNEFQAQTTHQLLQMHTLMIARNQAEAYRREQDDEARAKADLFYKQLFATDAYAPMKKHVWK
ncbi:MAG: hypothetical protein J6P19_09270 [Acetobacter sp.]|nr:hypothetical protein [Acetobacter sp.]